MEPVTTTLTAGKIFLIGVGGVICATAAMAAVEGVSARFGVENPITALPRNIAYNITDFCLSPRQKTTTPTIEVEEAQG